MRIKTGDGGEGRKKNNRRALGLTLMTHGFAPPSGIITPPSVWNGIAAPPPDEAATPPPSSASSSKSEKSSSAAEIDDGENAAVRRHRRVRRRIPPAAVVTVVLRSDDDDDDDGGREEEKAREIADAVAVIVVEAVVRSSEDASDDASAAAATTSSDGGRRRWWHGGIIGYLALLPYFFADDHTFAFLPFLKPSSLLASIGILICCRHADEYGTGGRGGRGGGRVTLSRGGRPWRMGSGYLFLLLSCYLALFLKKGILGGH